jgi:hypothetical protein
MPYKLTSNPTGLPVVPVQGSVLTSLLKEIDELVWTMWAEKSKSADTRTMVVEQTKTLINRRVATRSILNGDAICDESVNHERIWAADECYMMVLINVTHVTSVVARFYIKNPDPDSYFVLAKPVDPFTMLLDQYEKAQKEAAAAQETVSLLFKEIQTKCPHTEMVPKSTYIPGGYLNQSENITWTECTVCGYKTERKVAYGGFE